MKNQTEVSIELIGVDEVIEKLKQIKKLLNDIDNMNITIEVR